MVMYLLSQVARTTILARVISLGEHFAQSGLSRGIDLIAKVEMSGVLFSTLFDGDKKYSYRGTTKTGTELISTMEKMEVSADIVGTITVGNNRYATDLLNLAFGLEPFGFDNFITVLPESEADLLEIRSNTDHNLAKGFERSEDRLSALRLYQGNQVAIEDDLFSMYGYKRGKAQDIFRFARLIKDYKCAIDTVLPMANNVLTEAVKADNPKAWIEANGNVSVTKILTKKQIEGTQNMFANDLIKASQSAHLSGDLNEYKAAMTEMDDILSRLA